MMQTTAHTRSAALLSQLPCRLPQRTSARKPVQVARAQGDSYEKTEQPNRSNQAVKPYSERTSEFDEKLTSESANPIVGPGGVGPTDAMRFQGAAPELINSRAAMLGFVLAVIGYQTTGKNIWEQFQGWPVPVFGVFAIIAVASLVPILRGTPRKDFGPFTADGEVFLGRLAMLGVVGLFWLPFLSGYHVY